MKKRFLALLLCIVSLITILAFVGCDKSVSNYDKAAVTLNKKYILKADISKDANEQRYYVFTSKDRGYRVDYSYTSPIDVVGYEREESTTHYKMHFVYVFVEGTITYFFDSYEYFDDHTASKNSSGTSTKLETVLPAKEFLIDDSNSYYICEDFLDEIPNFR